MIWIKGLFSGWHYALPTDRMSVYSYLSELTNYPLSNVNFYFDLEEIICKNQALLNSTLDPSHAIIPIPISIADSSILKTGVCTPAIIPLDRFIVPRR